MGAWGEEDGEEGLEQKQNWNMYRESHYRIVMCYRRRTLQLGGGLNSMRSLPSWMRQLIWTETEVYRGVTCMCNIFTSISLREKGQVGTHKP